MNFEPRGLIGISRCRKATLSKNCRRRSIQGRDGGEEMKVTIDLCSGSLHSQWLGVNGIQMNIDAIQRAIEGKPLAGDFVLLMDTKTILEAIKEELK